MNEYNLSYREIITDQTVLDTWKEISLNTGGTQGTLQDIKVAERANGFCYRDSSKHHTRNRFIYWRISHDILELVEHSLDVNLSANRLRYRFVDTPILDGVSIHETYDNIVVLVPTVCSVHRLTFPHPDKYHRQDDFLGSHPDLAAPSIFSEATIAEARDPKTFHFFSNLTSINSQLPYLADSALTLDEEEAIFVLAYPTDEILLVKQSKDGKVISHDLKGESIVPKFLSGLADKLRTKDKEGDVTVSLILQTFGLETYALTLCRNGQLKFWSCSKMEYVAVIDVMSDTDAATRNQIQGAQNHIIRKAVDAETECLLAVFLSFSTESQICIFRPIVRGHHVQLIRLKTLRPPQNDLIDFTLTTSRIWSVWRGKEGYCEVYTLPFNGENCWTPVILEDVPDAEQPPTIDPDIDPGQAYLKYIFHPGRFPLHIITKALNIYKRSTIITDINLSATVLKQQICMAVEEEIQNELKETIVSDEDYLECANYCWQRFYSCCVQYYMAGLKPLGLLLLPYVSGAVLLKKSTFSILRPMDILEYMILCSDYMYPYQCSSHFLLNDNLDVTNDVIKLFEVIVYLEQQMSPVFAYTFQKELSLLKSPDSVMSELLEKIQSEMDTEFTEHATKMLKQCSDLYQAIHKTLELLRADNEINQETSSIDLNGSIGHIFTSHLGVSVVVESLKQQINNRFLICRNLLLICNILLQIKEIDGNVLEAVRSVCTPEIVVLTHSNHVMSWIANLPALNYLPTESSMQRLSSLKLSPIFNLKYNGLNTISILELFAGSTGGYEARKTFTKLGHNEDTLAHWHSSLLPFLNCLYQITWPISGSPILVEWLLSCGQHLWLQQYVRLLSNWCEWNSCTHSFLLAVSLLSTGEHYKALELFEVSAKGIFTDEFLAQRCLYEDETDQTRSYINYYLKVIHLFELHKGLDCAINLANTALSLTNKNDPLAATLYSLKFKHHLALKNYEKAYDSLNANPDSNRKKDNLRELVKKLLDEKKLDILMKFTFGDLEQLFCHIIFTRARATDAFDNIYYDFLYSYQIKRGSTFFRLAASVMYEQGLRLSQINSVEALEKQVKCYLAAKNALQLCDPKFAWIVMPRENIEEKHINLHLLQIEFTVKEQVKVVDLEIVKKELLFVTAKLKLLKFNPSASVELNDPIELVAILTASGLYKKALEICETFRLNNKSVFEMLTSKCASLTQHKNDEAWKWLIENDIQDLPSNTNSSSTAAWNLLKECLQMYEEDKMSIIHQIVCKQLIRSHMFIPYWLLDSYKRRNPPELLRLFYSSGRLEEAIDVATGLMMAALGHGKEYYGFDYKMDPTSPPFYLPIPTICMLLCQLEMINEKYPEKPFLKEYEQLKGIFEVYETTAMRVNNEMCQYKMSGIY